MILCSTGVLPIYQGIALVMGENIGTTVTSNLAALTANTQARRAAMAHMVFNVFGVLWVLCVFHPFINMVCDWVGYDVNMPKGAPGFAANAAKLSFVLAAFHTTFNLANTAILVGPIKYFEKYEGISDNMEIEIAKYLDQVSNAHLSDETKEKVRSMLREISELESIGDACYNIARTSSRLINSKEDFTQDQYDHMHQMFELTDDALTQMNRILVGHRQDNDVNRSFNIETEINNYRNQLRSQNINDVNDHKYTYAVGTMYMDIIQECEKLGDYVVNVVEARMGVRQQDA